MEDLRPANSVKYGFKHPWKALKLYLKYGWDRDAGQYLLRPLLGFILNQAVSLWFILNLIGIKNHQNLLFISKQMTILFGSLVFVCLGEMLIVTILSMFMVGAYSKKRLIIALAIIIIPILMKIF